MTRTHRTGSHVNQITRYVRPLRKVAVRICDEVKTKTRSVGSKETYLAIPVGKARCSHASIRKQTCHFVSYTGVYALLVGAPPSIVCALWGYQDTLGIHVTRQSRTLHQGIVDSKEMHLVIGNILSRI